MKKVLSKETIRGFLSVVAGVLVAMTIIFIAQLLHNRPFPVFAEIDPAEYYMLAQQSLPFEIRNEIIGLILGFFAGAMLTGLISSKQNKVHALLVPVIVLSIVAFTPGGFKLQKEIILLVLPLWMLIALAGYYISELINRRRRKKPV